MLDTVSTTCDSGWVKTIGIQINRSCMLIIYPPAIAGGTDCIQQKSLTFEAAAHKRLHGRLGEGRFRRFRYFIVPLPTFIFQFQVLNGDGVGVGVEVG